MTFWRRVLGEPLACDLKMCPLVTEQLQAKERQECESCRLKVQRANAT